MTLNVSSRVPATEGHFLPSLFKLDPAIIVFKYQLIVFEYHYFGEENRCATVAV